MGYTKEAERDPRIQVIGGAFGGGLWGRNTWVAATRWGGYHAPFFSHSALSALDATSLLSSVPPPPSFSLPRTTTHNLQGPVQNENVRSLFQK